MPPRACGPALETGGMERHGEVIRHRKAAGVNVVPDLLRFESTQTDGCQQAKVHGRNAAHILEHLKSK